MAPAVIAAIITGGISLFGIVITNIVSAKKHQEEQTKFVTDLFTKLDKQSELADVKLQAKLENFQAVTNEKIDELSRRVEKHNNLVERTYRLEENSAVMAEKMRNFDDRIDDLEKAAVH